MKASSSQNALVPTGGNALMPALTGSLGNIEAYISAVNRLPMLTQEEEVSLARRLRDQNDLGAAQKLILSHLRLVVAIFTRRQFFRMYSWISALIQCIAYDTRRTP